MRVTLLDSLFYPKSIAVFGESGLPGGSSSNLIHNLLQAGYSGKIFPVVPDCPEVCGLSAFSINQPLPAGVDLAVICLSLEDMIPVLEYCAVANIRTVISLALRETETRAEDCVHERMAVDLAGKKGIALLGPKSLGVLNLRNGVNVTLAENNNIPGNIAFFSQSASMFHTVLEFFEDEHLGLSKGVSLGHKSLINECDILEFLADDPATRVIVGYMEGVSDGPRFLRTAQIVAKRKPVIMIRPGCTPAGAKAALFHTDAMLGFADAYTTALHQTGVIRVPDIPAFLALARGFATQQLPHGNNVAIVTNSGSLGVMAADAAESMDMNLPRLSPAHIDHLRDMVPRYGNIYNPVVLGCGAEGETYARIMEEVSQDSRVDALFIILTPRLGTDVMALARSVAKHAAGLEKPVLVCLPGGSGVQNARYFLQEQGISCYRSIERAMYTLRAMHAYHVWQVKAYPVDVCYRRDSPKIKKILDDARKVGIHELSGLDIQGLLTAYELPFWEMKLARTAKSAAKISRKLGFPVVLKLASPQREENEAIRGVRTCIEENSEVYSAFWDITEGVRRVWPEIFISGCLVQKMADQNSREVCIRMVRDPQFGALISFTLVDGDVGRSDDTAHRLAPLSLEDAHDILREIRTFPLLQGTIGTPRAHLRSLEDMLLTMSQLATDCPEILEAELGPVFVDEYQATIAGAKVILAPWDAIELYTGG